MQKVFTDREVQQLTGETSCCIRAWRVDMFAWGGIDIKNYTQENVRLFICSCIVSRLYGVPKAEGKRFTYRYTLHRNGKKDFSYSNIVNHIELMLEQDTDSLIKLLKEKSKKIKES